MKLAGGPGGVERMARLLILVEGQTEEAFVNELLRDDLVGQGYDTVSARILGNARARDRRGGIRPWLPVKRDIVNHLRQDPGCIVATFVDFYGLPQGGDRGWPGRKLATKVGPRGAAEAVATALLEEVAAELGGGFRRDRFVPFVVLHEFEALLFRDCEGFSRAIGKPELVTALQAIREAFPTPEDINDSPETAPSKRVEALIPGYQKPLMGTLAALEIGLDSMRRECPHFDGWISRLGVLAAEGPG
jgi:hypothetical protein